VIERADASKCQRPTGRDFSVEVEALVALPAEVARVRADLDRDPDPKPVAARRDA